ncbi:hypothetical protein RCL1_003664 [Eukaryota sp. TZLM3-RCL]
MQQTAYRYLSRNLKPPSFILRQLQKEADPPFRPLCPGGVSVPLPITPNEHSYGSHNLQFTSFEDLSKPSISSFNGSKLVLPKPTISQKTLQEVAEQRESFIVNRLIARKQELSDLIPQLPPPLRQVAHNELLSIDLLPLQRRLRARATELITRVNKASIFTDVSLVRAPLSGPNEVMAEEKSAAIRRRQKKASFLDAVMGEHRKWTYEHQNKIKGRQRISRALIANLQAKDKREAIKKEREQRERMRLLKANDVEAYMNLVQEHKKDRLLTLIQQTESYLQSIGAMVETQRGRFEEEERKYRGTADQTGGVLSEEEIKKELRRETYYSLAHKVTERVEQPKMMEFGTLKEYQVEGLQWLVSLYNNRLNGILADEMGLGKTIQSVALIAYLYEVKKVSGQFLIIVPLSTISNWENEFARWTPSLSVIKFTGSKDHRKSLFKERIEPLKFQVCLTTYDFIMKDKKYLAKTYWLYIIVDEGHRMKNSGSKLTSILRKDFHSRNKLLLTGTPLQNSLPELWSLLNWLLPSIFSDVGSFQNWFAAPFDDKKDQDLEEEEEYLIINRLHQVLRPFLLRRLKSDVADQLPGKREIIIKVPLSAWQSVLYNRIAVDRTASMTSATGKQTTKGMQNTLMQLRKVCNHPWIFFENGIYDVTPSEDLIRVSGKFLVLDRLLPKMKATGHKVLIFTQMVQIMDFLGLFLSFRGFKYLRLDGGTKADERGHLLDAFNDPSSDYFVFLLSTRAGGLGLNLQTADTVIIFDSDWNPQADLQAQDRAHRIGQRNEVRVLRLCTITPIEENILSRAHHKLDIDSKIIQAGLYNPNATNEERKAALTELLQRPAGAMSDVTSGLDVVGLNKQVARSDEELILFGQMDEEYEHQRRSIYAPNPVPSELISQEELPIWLTNPQLHAPEEEKDYGRGFRRRAEVKYDEDVFEADEYLSTVLEEYLTENEDEREKVDEIESESEAGESSFEDDEPVFGKRRSEESSQDVKRIRDY